MKNKKLWFRAKKFGWGWTPTSWQGWAVTLLYITSILAHAPYTDIRAFIQVPRYFFISLSVPFVVNTIFLLIICYAYGEKPHWRWNGK